MGGKGKGKAGKSLDYAGVDAGTEQGAAAPAAGRAGTRWTHHLLHLYIGCIWRAARRWTRTGFWGISTRLRLQDSFLQLPMAFLELTRPKPYPMGVDAGCSWAVLRRQWCGMKKTYVWLDIFSIPVSRSCKLLAVNSSLCLRYRSRSTIN